MNFSEISSIIENLCRKAAPNPVYGSTIGALLNKETDDYAQIKKEYGGLRKFIEQFSKGKIVWVGKKGDNDMFGLNSGNYASTDAHPIPARSFWYVFSNPTNPEELSLHLATGNLCIAPAPSEGMNEYCSLPKVTPDEQLKFSKEFLSKIPEKSQKTLESLLSLPNYWYSWNKTIASLEGGMHRNEWKEFRKQRIIEIFISRIKDAGLSEALISYTVTQLTGLPPKSPFTQRHHAETTQRADTIELKRIASEAIKLLPDNAIRELHFPIGIVLDVIEKLRRKE